MTDERKPPARLSPKLKAIWKEIEPTLYADTPPTIVEAICAQVKTLRDARELIEKDGLIVQDGRNNAVEHPAIATERNAMRQLSELNKEWAIKEGE